VAPEKPAARGEKAYGSRGLPLEHTAQGHTTFRNQITAWTNRAEIGLARWCSWDFIDNAMSVVHAFGTNLQFAPGEFNFVKT
jgi:hypothetical protein